MLKTLQSMLVGRESSRSTIRSHSGEADTQLSAAECICVTEFVAARHSGKLDYSGYLNSIIKGVERSKRANIFISHDPSIVRRRASESLKSKPLAGIPFAVKDNILTEDYPTSNGTRALSAWNPGVDAPLVSKLRALGAVLLGKTNMPEFCQHMSCDNAVFGPVLNPFDERMFVGGSSSGAAAGVAGGVFPFAIGSDTGGSVRIPASLTGCCGFRPTTGRYSTEGFVPVTPAADTPGILARNVSDVQLIDSLLIDETGKVRKKKLSELRIGVPGKYFSDNLDDDIRSATLSAIDALRASKAKIIEADIPGLAELAPATGFPIAFYEMMRQLAFFFLQHPIPMTLSELVDSLEGAVERGAIQAQFGEDAVSYQQYLKSMQVNLPKLRYLYDEYFDNNRLDVFVVPTTIAPAKSLTGNGPDAEIDHCGQRAPTFPTYIHNTEPTSFAGVPAISIPSGVTSAGLPVGLEIVGKRGTDRDLLHCAAMIESCLSKPPRVYY